MSLGSLCAHGNHDLEGCVCLLKPVLAIAACKLQRQTLRTLGFRYKGPSPSLHWETQHGTKIHLRLFVTFQDLGECCWLIVISDSERGSLPRGETQGYRTLCLVEERGILGLGHYSPSSSPYNRTAVLYRIKERPPLESNRNNIQLFWFSNTNPYFV